MAARSYLDLVAALSVDGHLVEAAFPLVSHGSAERSLVAPGEGVASNKPSTDGVIVLQAYSVDPGPRDGRTGRRGRERGQSGPSHATAKSWKVDPALGKVVRRRVLEGPAPSLGPIGRR